MAFCSLNLSQNVYWAYIGMKRSRMFFAELIQMPFLCKHRDFLPRKARSIHTLASSTQSTSASIVMSRSAANSILIDPTTQRLSFQTSIICIHVGLSLGSSVSLMHPYELLVTFLAVRSLFDSSLVFESFRCHSLIAPSVKGLSPLPKKELSLNGMSLLYALCLPMPGKPPQVPWTLSFRSKF